MILCRADTGFLLSRLAGAPGGIGSAGGPARGAGSDPTSGYRSARRLWLQALVCDRARQPCACGSRSRSGSCVVQSGSSGLPTGAMAWSCGGLETALPSTCPASPYRPRCPSDRHIERLVGPRNPTGSLGVSAEISSLDELKAFQGYRRPQASRWEPADSAASQGGHP